eukprot:TRINITY_DN4976_c0_g1_i1.p1 TRINITY_DN4976_c0_g1~~TRINITY_DN4976_c0_g1_i1.p1  ORF type:complete len:572 (-),score=123.14 TRINITY_DN4976_c0_g1_i1:148-1725(-)
MAAQEGLIQSQEVYALPSPSKAGQKMKTAAPDAKKRSRKAPSADGGSQLATSPGPGQRGNLSGASTSSCSSNSMSPAQAPNVKVAPQGTPPPAAAPAGGLQARLRPGGLLDAMRQRGTHPGSGFQSPHLAPAPGVVPATPRSFGTASGAAVVTSTSSTATPGGCGRNISSTGSTSCSPGPCSSSVPLAASPPQQHSGVAAVPLPPASLMPPSSPAKTTSRNFDFSLSPLLPKAAQAQERMEASLPTGAATPSCSSSTESRKRSREEGSPAPAPAAPVAVAAAAEMPLEQQQQQRSAQHPAGQAVLQQQQQAQVQQVQKAGKAPRKRSGNKGDAGLPASPARAASPAARAPGSSPATSPVRAREPGSARAKRPPVPSFKKQPPAPPPPPEPWQLVRMIKLPPKDPSENYELSDKGSDSEAEEPDRTQKFTPAWSDNYLELLDAQADIDADSIFSTRVPHCDLDLIFSDKDYLKFRTERPRRKRGSSGEWRRDRLSRAEISEYKRKMGHHRRWDTRKEAKIAAGANS